MSHHEDEASQYGMQIAPSKRKMLMQDCHEPVPALHMNLYQFAIAVLFDHIGIGISDAR